MARHLEGLFDVTLTPQPGPGGPDTGLGRLTLEKRYHGDLDAAGVGEMLSTTTPVRDSAGYVAMERVTGTLQGRRGSFALQHSGTMNRGASTLTITVVPDSGTDELEGISGTMTITLDGPTHIYGFDYNLPGGGT
jgi:hypothetical protein